MLKNSKKLFLLFGVILCAFCFNGCSSKRNDTSSFIHIDFFYKKKDNFLVDNKVTIGIGNSLFDENNVKVLPIDDDYYQGITNISITVFIDDDIEPKNKIEIANKDFFSSEYIVNRKRKKINVRDYKKTFVFDLSDYEINNVIKFAVSYDWTYQENTTNHSNKLFLYGEFFNNKFNIREENTMYIM